MTPVAATAADEEPAARLKTIEQGEAAARQQIEDLNRQAADLTAEILKLQDAAVAAAQVAQETEAQLSQIEDQQRRLTADLANRTQALALRQAHEAAAVAALQRIALDPPAALLLAPGAPIDQVRRAVLLGRAVPALAAEAEALAADADALERTRSELEARRLEAGERRITLLAERRHIADLLRQKQALEGQTRAEAQAAQRRATLLGAEAGDLRDLIRRLEAERRQRLAEQQAEEQRRQQALHETAPGRPPAEGPPQVAGVIAPKPPRPSGKIEPGGLHWPASGRITHRFGENDGVAEAKGLSIETRLGAEIVAPAAGTVMFAGPFKGYGQILIIDHGGGYHSLLAGVDQIEAGLGQPVVAGEPVGVMRAEGAAPILYFELRRQGQPVDPMPWLAASDGKVSG